MITLGLAPEVAGDQPDAPADVRPSTTENMPTASDTRAPPDDAGEDVAPDLVGAQPVVGVGPAAIAAEVGALGSWSGRQVGERSAAMHERAIQPTQIQKGSSRRHIGRSGRQVVRGGVVDDQAEQRLAARPGARLERRRAASGGLGTDTADRRIESA